MMDSDLDHMSHSGAILLARWLRKFWLARGYNVGTRVESLEIRGRAEVWVMRSNLVGGLPPDDARVEVLDEAA